MATPNTTVNASVPSQETPFLVPGTQVISPPWRLFLTLLLSRTGGTTGIDVEGILAQIAALAALVAVQGPLEQSAVSTVFSTDDTTADKLLGSYTQRFVDAQPADTESLTPVAYAEATEDVSGLMSTTDKVLLDSLSADPTHISGLQLQWVNGASIAVSSGMAYIPSEGKSVLSPTTLTLTAIPVTANAWHHVYLFMNAGVPAIEINTVAPAAPYLGFARTKTGDTSRRYLGSMVSNASAALWKIAHFGSKVFYQDATSNFIVLFHGVATTTTTVPCAGFAPITAVSADLNLANAVTSASVFYGNSLMPTPALSASNNLYTQPAMASSTIVDFPLDASQQFSYALSGAPLIGAVDTSLLAYTFLR